MAVVDGKVDVQQSEEAGRESSRLVAAAAIGQRLHPPGEEEVAKGRPLGEVEGQVEVLQAEEERLQFKQS